MNAQNEQKMNVCMMCEQGEQQCQCDKYCCICMGSYAIRLCLDGLYYCPACAECCEASIANPNDDEHWRPANAGAPER
jgi:hypothetical protein